MHKTILITGATGAIGSATAHELAKSGSTLVLLARNRIKVETLRKEILVKSGNPNIDILIGDLSSISSTKNAAGEFKRKYKRLDVLLNIAAIYKRDRIMTKDNLETMFATNHLGPFILTTELLDLLKQSSPSRIINLTAPSTTELKFWDLQGDAEFSSLNAFGATKMMNLLFTFALAHRLQRTGVTSNAFFPGLTKSDLTKEMPVMLRTTIRLASRQPQRPALMLAHLSLDPVYQYANGKFFKYNGKEIHGSSYAYDVDTQNKLWQISEELRQAAAIREIAKKAA